MPVTMPRTVTVVPLQAALSPSVWIFVIGVVPSGPWIARAGRDGAVQVGAALRRASSAVRAGEVGGLSSVSCVPSSLRMNPPWARPRRGTAGRRPRGRKPAPSLEPTASITCAAAAALRITGRRPCRRCPCRTRRRRRGVGARRVGEHECLCRRARVVPCGTAAREPSRGGVLLLEAHSSQPPMFTGRPRHCGSRSPRRCRRAGRGRPPARSPRGRTRVRRVRRRAATTSAADASAKRRVFTVEESFPEGNPKDSAQPYRCTGRMGDGLVIRRAAAWRDTRGRSACPRADIVLIARPTSGRGRRAGERCRRGRCGRRRHGAQRARASTAPDGRRCCGGRPRSPRSAAGAA